MQKYCPFLVFFRGKWYTSQGGDVIICTTSMAIRVLPNTTDIDKILSIVVIVMEYIVLNGFHFMAGPFETPLMEILKHLCIS